MLWKEAIAVTTAGADGSAVGTAYSHNTVMGYIHAAYVDYSGTLCPSTTDLTVGAASTPTENIINLANGTTDAWIYPRRQVHNNAGTGLTLEGTEPVVDKYIVYDRVKVVVGDCNAITDAVTVYLFWEEP